MSWGGYNKVTEIIKALFVRESVLCFCEGEADRLYSLCLCLPKERPPSED